MTVWPILHSPFSILNYLLPAERTKRTGESIAAVAVILLRIIVLAALALLGLGIRVIALEVVRIGQRDGDIERLAGRNAVYAQRQLVASLLILLEFVYLIHVRGRGTVNGGDNITDLQTLTGCLCAGIIGEGWHEHIGGLHAERNAFAHCTEDCTGADLYVTLEPCCHWGRTPPCTDAVIEHKIGRVFVGCLDPNPLVAGKGAQILRDAGIEVETGVCEDECRRVNEVFFHYITHKTPFVTLKYAMTLDGKIAAHTGDSRWVTGETARRHVHETRNRLPAIMVGIGTVLEDDPLLTCRIDGGRDPIRVICDSRARTPIDSRIVQTANKIPTYIAVVGRNERTAELERHGVHILECKTKNERVDLADLMRQLGALGIDGLLLEGGSALAFSALEAGVVHRVQAYIAPKIIGGAGAKSPVGGLGFDKMVQALPLKDVTCTPMDEDFLIEGRL